MMNSVSFSGKTASAYQATAPKKTSNAKKGAQKMATALDYNILLAM